MDKESLYLSEQVLGANPDFSTLWNFRREIFLHMKDEKYVLNICSSLTRFSLFVDITASLAPIIIIKETSIKHITFLSFWIILMVDNTVCTCGVALSQFDHIKDIFSSLI